MLLTARWGDLKFRTVLCKLDEAMRSSVVLQMFTVLSQKRNHWTTPFDSRRWHDALRRVSYCGLLFCFTATSFSVLYHCAVLTNWVRKIKASVCSNTSDFCLLITSLAASYQERYSILSCSFWMPPPHDFSFCFVHPSLCAFRNINCFPKNVHSRFGSMLLVIHFCEKEYISNVGIFKIYLPTAFW